MRTWAIFASLILFFVVAQSQSNSDLDLAIMAIQAHFNQSHIVPDFLANFQPEALLDVSFGELDDLSFSNATSAVLIAWQDKGV